MTQKTDIKTSFGWIEVNKYTSNPTDTDSSRGGFAIVGDVPKYFVNGSWNTLATIDGTETLTNKTLTTPTLTTPTIDGQKVAITTKSADYTATATDYVLLVDATSAAVTITLPAVATSAGLVYVIKKIDAANNVVIDGNAAETIDGAATVTLSAQWQSKMIACDGTAWFVISTS
jgi:hypothetical protein